VDVHVQVQERHAGRVVAYAGSELVGSAHSRGIVPALEELDYLLDP
jgi:hypothetical protein